MMDDDSDGSGSDDYEQHAEVDLEFPEHPRDLQNDDEYSGECGWWIVVMLRGKSTGRKLKRDIFKVALSMLVFGFVLFVCTVFINRNFSATPYFGVENLGATLLSLLWLVSFPSCLEGILLMLFVKYWATLVTNREILLNLMRGTMIIMFMLLVSTGWCIGCMIMAFRGVRFMVSHHAGLSWPCLLLHLAL
jgi:hypothetical protein